MYTLRVIRHDRQDLVLADCTSTVVPARGETLVLDTLDARGEAAGPNTCWRVVAVTVHVPSARSVPDGGGAPLQVRLVEVFVRPDGVGVPELAQSAQEILSESRM